MNANKTVKQFSWGKAVVFLILVSLFYLASGLGEFLMAMTEMESIPSGKYFLLDLYRDYLGYLGLATMVIGGLLFIRLNFARVAAIAIAWWNIFTGPLMHIWSSIYYVKIKKLLVIDPRPWTLMLTIIIIIALVLIRLLIIYLLKRSKPGCMSIIQDLKK